MTSPPIKWVGGKGRLLPQLLPLLDLSGITTYVEPFLGSGALFFALDFDAGDKVVLGDKNGALINIYRSLRDAPSSVMTQLEAYEQRHRAAEDKGDARKFYDGLRAKFNSFDAGDAVQAARFLYLNRTCFNGVYRVNKDGAFNVPIGDYKRPAIYNEELLKAVSAKLNREPRITLVEDDFETTIRIALGECGNPKTLFAYLDPPYAPVSETADFTSYTKEKWDEADLLRLRSMCDALDAAGAWFMLSNSDAQSVRKLFKKYNITTISRRGNINSDVSKRGDVAELVIRNYRGD